MVEAHLGWGDWYFEPTVTIGLVALVAMYVVAMRRGLLRSDDDVSPWFRSTTMRPVCFGLGILVAVIALLSPIDRGGDRYLFSIHMVQHLLLMMVAPPLALLGIAGGQGVRERAVRVPRSVRVLLGSITRLWPAAIVFATVMLVWHIPALYNEALTVQPLHVFEHITFVAAGVVFWWPIVDPWRTPASRVIGPLAKVAMLTVSGIPPTLLGFLFALTPTPLYSFYTIQPRLWGLSPVTDQQWAGVLMFGAGNVIYFVAITAIFLRMFEDPERDEREAQAAGAATRRPLGQIPYDGG